jgi:hypothetical protein
MKKKNGAGGVGFHAGGSAAYLRHLDGEEEKLLAELRTQLKLAADPLQKENLKKAIARIEAEFRQKRKNSGFSLF